MPAAIDSPSPQRALIAVEPAAREAQAQRMVLRRATLLTHLIAAARQLPQARARRRAESGDAIAAYREIIRKLRA
jgi:hypothetical protein